MRKALVITTLLLLLGAGLFMFWPFGGPEISAMPVFPAVVSEPGIYELDSTRFVVVRESGAGAEYFEGTVVARSDSLIGPEKLTYVTRGVDSVVLGEGWSIGFVPPGTIIIDPGTGPPTERTFGEQPPPRIDVSGVLRRMPDAGASPDGWRRAGGGEGADQREASGQDAGGRHDAR